MVRAAFPIGTIALAYLVVSPHQLLNAVPILIGVIVFGLIAGAAIFTAPPKLRTRPGHKLACLLPWILCAILVINWSNDRSPEIRHSAKVLETHYSSGWDYLVVKSWRPGRDREVLFLKTWFTVQRHWPTVTCGDSVWVGVRSGALQLPWISSMSK